MLKRSPILPATVTDQIRLWELERDRFQFQDGLLYDQFLSQNDFDVLRNYARVSLGGNVLVETVKFVGHTEGRSLNLPFYFQEIGALVWENPQKRFMVVSRSGHEDVRRYWKEHKSNS